MNGEDFAYYRWHCLKWPDAGELDQCIGGAQAWCIHIWRDMQRRQP